MEKATSTALYSKKISAQGKPYFFDVKSTAKGGKYMTITESRKQPDGKWKRNSIILFEDGIEDFAQALGEVSDQLKKA